MADFRRQLPSGEEKNEAKSPSDANTTETQNGLDSMITETQNALSSITKRKASTFGGRNSSCKKMKQSSHSKRWNWSDSQIEEMLKFVRESKSKCEFSGVDFEADLQSLYTEARRRMGSLYPNAFGAETLTESETSIKDMDKHDYEIFKTRNDLEKSNIRKGYDRVKGKIKSIRQDYRNAVNKGSHSGSGKIVQDNFDLPNDIWLGLLLQQ